MEKNKLMLLIAGAVMLASVNALAQFQYSFGTINYEEAQSVQFTSDQGYIMAGRTSTQVFGGEDATLVKTDANGSTIWSKVFGGSKFEIFNFVREVNFLPSINPKFVAAGFTKSYGFGGDDVYLVGVDANGNQLFSNTFGGIASDKGHCVQPITDPVDGPGYIIVGETKSFPSAFPGKNIYVIRTDGFGNLKRSVVIGGEGDQAGFWIEQTSDRGYILTGYTTRACNSRTANQDIFVVKLRSDLSVEWNTIIGGGSLMQKNDVGFCIKENPLEKSFVLTGITRSFGVNGYGDAFIVNLSSTGTFNWMKTYGGGRTDVGRTLLVDRDFAGNVNYVIGGYSNSNKTINQNALLFKTDAGGSLLWTRYYGDSLSEQAFEIHKAPQGYVLGGRIRTFSVGSFDKYLVRTDFNGKSGTGCEYERKQLEDKHEPCLTSGIQYVYVDPEKPLKSLEKDFKYDNRKCESFARREGFFETTGTVALYEVLVAPNPASSTVMIKYHEAYTGGRLLITDVHGQLLKEALLSGAEGIELAVDDLPKGVYLVRIIKENAGTLLTKFVKD